MNAHKRGISTLALTAMALVAFSGSALSAPMDARSNTKVQGAMAKKWSGQAQATAVNPAQQNKQIVNYGSKKDNTCNLNIGTAQAAGKGKAGQRTPKDIVVTTKDVINICK
jgi:hypothetical protein